MRVLLVCLMLLVPATLAAQPAKWNDGASSLAEAERSPRGTYLVPFASADNRIELMVANAAGAIADDVTVTVTVEDAPAWLEITPRSILLEGLAAGAERPAAFSFSVAQAAPIGEAGTLRFAITTSRGAAEQVIPLEVEAPKEVLLEENYPNPFNPATTIGYTLPGEGRVSLRVYDVVGREVARLVENWRPGGHHSAIFDGADLASGLYVYRLVVDHERTGRTVKQRSMMMVK